jgi:hypothetical protein
MSLGDIVGGAASGAGAIEQGMASQTAANSQSKMNDQTMQALQSLLGSYNSSYAPALGPTGSDVTAEASGAGSQANGLASLFQSLGADPAMIQQLTGINANAGTQALTNYASNPGQTQLGQIAPGAIGQMMNTGGTNLAGANQGLSSFYQNEQKNGINPQTANNAQDQLQQGYNQAVSNVNANAQPGQNTNAQQQDMFNSLLSQKTNLAGNLAGQSQQFMNQGAQGVAQTAGGLDSQTMSMLMNALQSSGMLNSATLGNLQAGSQAGQSANQTALGNVGSASSSSQNAIDQAMNFIGQGRSSLIPGINAGQSMAQNYGVQAQNAGNNASNLAGSAITSFLNGGNRSSGGSSGGGYGTYPDGTAAG